MKVAIVYDRVNKWGGAERVLLTLHEIFPKAPLYTSVYNPRKALWAKAFPSVETSFLQKLPFIRNHHEIFPFLMPIAFEYFNFEGYDLVISVTSEAAKGILTKPSTLHICYCLTPTRYLWSHYHFYFKSKLFSFFSKPIVGYLRYWDKIAAQRPDVMVGISKAVQERIRKFYGRTSQLIYPPVDVRKIVRISKKSVSRKKYYLVVSRLVPYKRVDLVIEAFNDLALPLVIVGVGSEEKKLRSLARKNITFKSFVREDELIKLYIDAKALIQPQEEDFGMVAVEAQAAGTPVIAYRKGGAKETVIEGKTGIFFDEQSKESIIEAVGLMESHGPWDKNVLFKNAEKFSKEKFKEKIKVIVDKYTKSKLK